MSSTFENCGYGHDTFQQDDDPAVSFALHLHEYTHYSIEFTSGKL